MHSRLPQQIPSSKKIGGVISGEPNAAVKVIFVEYGILYKLMSDAGTNFVSDRFRRFCSSLNIEQAVSSAYHHQSNGQAKACIKIHKMPV